jgi:hypothetical protein
MLTSNQFSTGMIQDVMPKVQPDGSYRYALNAMLETTEGEVPAISNEMGNSLCATNFPEGKYVVGSVNMPDEKVIVLLADPTTFQHEIGILDSISCNYESKVTASCLNFKLEHPVNVIYKKRNSCEDVIYFTDNYNRYRAINLSNLNSYDFTNNCDQLDVTRRLRLPSIGVISNPTKTIDQNQAGRLMVGTYSFAIRYLDDDENATPWLFVSRPVAIADGSYKHIDEVTTHSFYDGGSANPDSDYFTGLVNKAIQIQLANLDITFKYYQLAVIKRTTDEGALSEVDILPPEIIDPIDNDPIYVYRGIDTPKYGTASLSEILVPPLNINTAKAHNFFDGRLFIGNVTSTKYNFAQMQRAATAIKVEWTKTPVTSPVGSRVKAGEYYLELASFMEDEVYAFAVQYEMEDGTFSPPFHIPGRGFNNVTIGHHHPIKGKVTSTTQEDWDDELLMDWKNVSTCTVDSASYNNLVIMHSKSANLNNSQQETPATVSGDYVAINPEVNYKLISGETYWGYHTVVAGSYTICFSKDAYDGEVLRTVYGFKLVRNNVTTTYTITNAVAGVYNNSVQHTLNLQVGDIIYAFYRNPSGQPTKVNEILLAVIPNLPNQPLKGLMGYWETTTTYPEIDISECDNHPDGYWGRTWQGELITSSSKIRHHKMPGAEITIVPGISNVVNNRTGVIFSNTSRPPGTKSIRFLYGKRDKDYTIVAKGLAFPLWVTGDKRYIDYRQLQPYDLAYNPPVATYPNLYVFISAEPLIRGLSLEATKVKLEKAYIENWNKTYVPGQSFVSFADEIKMVDGNYADVHIRAKSFYYSKAVTHTTFNYAFNSTINNLSFLPQVAASAIDPPSAFDPTLSTYTHNKSISNNYHVFSVDSPLSTLVYESGNTIEKDRVNYVSLKIDSDPFNFLQDIAYVPIDTKQRLSTQNPSLNVRYTLYGGDTFINNVGFTHAEFKTIKGDEDEKDVDIFIYAAYNNFSDQSSKVNYAMRHGNIKDSKDSYFKFSYTNPPVDTLISYLKNSINTDKGLPSLQPEAYHYNESYSYINSINEYYALPNNYDYCSDCVNNYPDRLYASQVDSKESSEDLNRIILTGNYRDLESITGAITDIFPNFNKLYATTTRSLYMIPTRPQTLSTEEQTVYVGSGELFALPPVQLKTSNYAFGGQSSFISRINTGYGVTYMDDLSQTPFLFADQLTDISMQSMRNFFKEHGRVHLMDQFRSLTGQDFPYFSPYYCGYIAGYDPRHRRVLLTKKDFKIKDSFTASFKYKPTQVAPNTLYFDGEMFKFLDKLGNTATVIPAERADLFDNYSFTISYGLSTKSFISFHSYLPNFYFNSTDTYFSGLEKPYRHLQGNYQVYYGEDKKEHVVDLIAKNNAFMVATTDSIGYTSNVYEYNDSTMEYKPIDVTYDKFIAYNSKGISGLLTLQPHTVFMVDDIPTVKRTDNIYKINNLRDLALDDNLPLWSSNPQDTQAYFPIDKVPNPSNLDPTKTLFNKPRFRDHYFGLRLFFNPPANYKIVTDILTTINSNRNR